MRQIVIILSLLLTLFATPLSSSVRRLSADPRMGFRPKAVRITVILDGDERILRVALVDEDGFIVRASTQELTGEHQIVLLWARPPVGDLTIHAVTIDAKGVESARSLDLHYL